MGERTVMDTADVSALTQRIQELEREKARLKVILDENGIEYGSFESKNCRPNHVEAPRVSTRQFTLQEKVSIFQSVFQGRDDAFAKRWHYLRKHGAGAERGGLADSDTTKQLGLVEECRFHERFVGGPLEQVHQ